MMGQPGEWPHAPTDEMIDAIMRVAGSDHVARTALDRLCSGQDYYSRIWEGQEIADNGGQAILELVHEKFVRQSYDGAPLLPRDDEACEDVRAFVHHVSQRYIDKTQEGVEQPM